MQNKKKILIFLIPSLLFNYFTLTILDNDSNLSTFSTLIIFLFNILNLIFAYIFSYFELKKSLIIFFIITISIIFIDTFTLMLQKKKSIQVYDRELGWLLNNNINIETYGNSKHKKKYKINFYTSSIKGFREYDDDRNYNKNILVIGDSFTAGPFASNDEMYYSYIKEELEKEGYFYNWYVAGGGGYGTLQQYLLIKKHFNQIKPDIIIHQFCENDFENNSLEIEKNSILNNQYFFRPYILNNKIVYDESYKGMFYKILYNNSFLFKKIEQLITNYRYKINEGYYNKNNYEKNFKESIQITSKIFRLIKNIVGDKILYISVNCSSKNKEKFYAWENILKDNKIINLSQASLLIEDKAKLGEDIFFFDGGHLNNYGNKIFGKKIGIDLIKILKNE